jgi:HEAT repeat protein
MTNSAPGPSHAVRRSAATASIPRRLAVLGVLGWLATLGQARAMQEGAGNTGAQGSLDIVAIARAEAAREAAALKARCETLLAELRSSTDENNPFVASRLAELAGHGSAAIDALLAAMNHPDVSPATRNAAVNAARALARIPGQAAVSGLLHLAREGQANGRRHAAIAIGARGDRSLLGVLRELVEDAEPQVVVQALIALGQLGGEESLLPLRKRVGDGDKSIAAAAMRGLASAKDAGAAEAIRNRLATELAGENRSDDLLEAACGYFATTPDEPATALCIAVFADPNRTREARIAAVHAMQFQASSLEAVRRGVVTVLVDGLQQASGPLLEAIAAGLYALGDERGLDQLTAGLDQQIRSEPKNFQARYQRGEILLQFRNYKAARRDYLDGLKIEREPRSPERVYVPLARCAAGLDDLREAEKHLKKLGDIDLSDLPRQFSEFARMANDSNYERLFARKGA